MDEHDEIVDALRRFFDEPRAELATGPLADWLALPSPGDAQRAAVTHIRVENVTEDRARADITGSLERVWRSEGRRTQSQRVRIDGPVTLVRLRGEWRVTDFFLDDQSLVSTLHTELPPEQAVGGVHVRVPGAMTRAGSKLVAVELENAGAQPVRPKWAAGRSHRRWRNAWLGDRGEVAAGERRTIWLQWRSWTRKDRLRFVLVLEAPGEELAFDVRTGGSTRPGPERPRVPITLRVRRHPLLRLVPPLSLVAAIVLARFDALIALLVFFAGLALLTEVGAHTLQVGLRPYTRRLAAALAMVVAGGLFWSGNQSGAYSGCRLLGRHPDRTADAFVTALLTRGPAAARRYLSDSSSARLLEGRPHVAGGVARRILATRDPHAPFCALLKAAGARSGSSPCYGYSLPRRAQLTVMLTCRNFDWRVRAL